MQRLLLLGLNHTTAPLAVRERLAFDADGQRRTLEKFQAEFPACEAVLLSTCNRVELYAARPVHEKPAPAEIMRFLAESRGLAMDDIEPHLYLKTNREVVEHLFTVASSLDSMVLGETQILGQVRQAYEAASKLQSARKSLHPLFQRAINVGKQVMAETTLAEGRVSVASVAVDYARQIFERFDDKTVLSIGAGKMAALVLQAFVSLRPGKLLICNRGQDKAQLLASKFNGQPVPFETLADHVVSADIVITSTGATEPIINRAQFEKIMRRRRYRPIFLIDIAFPRDIDSAVGEVSGAYLYNLDDLQKVVSGTRSSRQSAVSDAQQMITRAVEDFSNWNRQRELGPTITRLYSRYHAVAQEELERTINKLPNLSATERSHLEDLARRIVNKLLHDPVQALRSADSSHALPVQYFHALEKLFSLPSDDIESGPDSSAPPEAQGGETPTGDQSDPPDSQSRG